MKFELSNASHESLKDIQQDKILRLLSLGSHTREEISKKLNIPEKTITWRIRDLKKANKVKKMYMSQTSSGKFAECLGVTREGYENEA